MHKAYKAFEGTHAKTFFKPAHINPNQMRWNPMPEQNGNFLEGLRTVCGTGSSHEQRGIEIHLYSFSAKYE